MNTKNIFLLLLLVAASSVTKAQEENSLKLSGELLTDQRFFLNHPTIGHGMKTVCL